MSEMSSGEGELTALELALIEFTGCVGEAIPDICSYGLTIGETYVPFDPDEDEDCADDEAICSQLWVRVTGVQPTPGGVDGFSGQDCSLTLSLGLEVGVIRCIEVAEGGEAPTSSQVLVAAMQSMDDMNKILCAALGCEVWDSINVGQWAPNGPLGGQYGGVWTFTVELP